MDKLAIYHGKILHLPVGIAQNLTGVLLKTAKQTSKKGITYIQSDATEFQSYSDLREAATKILTGLKQLGLKPKDKVILQLGQNQDFIEAFWACILGGFVPVPLATAPIYDLDNSAAKKLRTAWQILDKPLILTNEKLAAPIRNLAVQLKLENLKLATLNQLPSSISKSNVDYHSAKPDDVALMLLTSGSTGVPKTVKLSHQNILNSIAATSQMGEFTSQDISLNWLPLDHPGPLIRCVIRMVYLGCQQLHAPTTTVLQEPLKWLDWLDRYRVTTTWAPNFAFALLNDRAEEIKQRDWDLTSVVSLLNTAEPIVPQTAMRTWELLNPHGLSKTAMHSSWGMAETSSGVTYSKQYLSECSSSRVPLRLASDGAKHQRPEGTLLLKEAVGRSPTPDSSFAELGLPIPGIVLRIVDDRDRIVTESTIGFLQVKGATVTSGYEQNPEANREAFTTDGWFKTGDLGFLDRGRLTITGRIKDVIIINGNNIYSHEIEGVVEEIEEVEVSYTAACGIREPNSNTDRLAVFFHTTISEDEALLELLKKIQQHIVRKLGISPAYLIPVEREAIPKTSIGKIQRSQLKQRFEAGEFDAVVERIDILQSAARNNVEQVAPRTELERQLASIWQQVLNVPTVGINDDFFELGGHSILVFQTISRLRENLKIELPIQYLFQAPTIGQLSESIERGDLSKAIDTRSIAIPVRGQTQAPLSYVQQGLWFLDRLEGQNATYNLPLVLRLTGSLNHDCLQLAIATVIERHEALRTRFITVEGSDRQEIVPPAAIDLNLIDLREFALGERDWRVIQLAQEEARLSFDLTQAPLIRAKLLYLEDNNHVLLLTVHHIVADGWSMNVLTDELWTIYQGLTHQTEAELKPLPIQYADFALWQQEHFNDVTLAPQLEYWQNQLAGIPPILELPLDRPRPAKQTFAGSSQSFQLSQELTDQLQALAQRSGSTLYMTVLAAFGVLMHRYSRQSDIVIGSPIANRNYHEVESLIGFFVNTLALRLDLANQPSFVALLQQVRQVTLDAYAHQDVPFSKVVEQLELNRDLSHHPIFQVMFTWQNIPDYHQESGDLSVKQIRVESVVAKFDLDVSMVKSESGLEGTFTYNTDLFDAATIERMTAHFQTLLEGIVDNPQQPIAQLPLLTPAEREQLLVEWNDTDTEYPQDKCIHQLFEEQVERTPDAVAVIFEGQQLTYRELNQRANQLAHYLQKLGVKPDMLVGICVDRSVEMVVGLLGILKAGGAYVPLDPNYPQERISFMVENSQLSVILTQSHLQKGSQHSTQVICLDSDREIAQEDNVNLDIDLTPDNLAYIIYTSGSTGKPKGVQIIHRAVVNFLTSMSQKPGLSSEDALLAVTTISFDIAVLELFLPITVGARIVLASREVAANATELSKLLAESEATVMQATPATWRMLLAAGWQGKENFKILCGGEAMPRTLADELSKSSEVWNMYGPTETTIWSAVERVEPEALLIGRAIANTKFYLINTNSYQSNGAIELVPVGVAGELLIGGVGLARGYLNRSELTAEKFLPNPFSSLADARLYRTGDLARYLPNGKIELIGRIDNQVKIRGFRIELGEIEAVLVQHSSICETVVVAREDIPGDKRLVAYVVTQEQPHSSDLRSFVAERLPNYMVPSAFVFLDTLPLTPNGKVDRRALPALDADNIQLDTNFVPPSNPTEETLATIWADVLGVDRVGIHDNFFELGGHSLLATTLVSRLDRAFAVELTIRNIFETPTIASLSLAITQSQSEYTEDEEIGDLLAELEGLTDEEVQQLLAEEMQ